MESLSEKKAPRVGLVLCGGGAKGAYQIGCWKALRAAGVDQFDIISGASVGALNAVLIGNGDVTAAEKLWIDLSQAKVAKMALPAYRYLVFALLAAIYIFRSAFYYLFVYPTFIMAAMFSLFVVAPFEWILGFDWIVRFHVSVLIVFILPLLLFMWLPVAMSIHHGPKGMRLRHDTILPVKIRLPRVALLPIDSITLKGSRFWSTAIFLSKYLPLASSVNLATEIKKNVLNSSIPTKCRIYSIESIMKKCRDPFYPIVFNDAVDPTFIQFSSNYVYTNHTPSEFYLWTPQATELTALRSKKAITSALLRSAKMPLYFRAREEDAGLSADGFVASSIPIMPAVLEACDLIIIISLDDTLSMTREEVCDIVDQNYLQNIMSSLSRLEAKKLYNDLWKDTGHIPANGLKPKYPACPHRVGKIVVISPSEYLRSPTDFTGGDAARRIIEIGERDARRVLESHGASLFAPIQE